MNDYSDLDALTQRIAQLTAQQQVLRATVSSYDDPKRDMTLVTLGEQIAMLYAEKRRRQAGRRPVLTPRRMINRRLI